VCEPPRVLCMLGVGASFRATAGLHVCMVCLLAACMCIAAAMGCCPAAGFVQLLGKAAMRHRCCPIKLRRSLRPCSHQPRRDRATPELSIRETSFATLGFSATFNTRRAILWSDHIGNEILNSCASLQCLPHRVMVYRLALRHTECAFKYCCKQTHSLKLSHSLQYECRTAPPAARRPPLCKTPPPTRSPTMTPDPAAGAGIAVQEHIPNQYAAAMPPATITHVDFRPDSAKAAAAAAPPNRPLRLVTWNIERGYQLPLIIEQLKQVDAGAPGFDSARGAATDSAFVTAFCPVALSLLLVVLHAQHTATTTSTSYRTHHPLKHPQRHPQTSLACKSST